MKIDLKSIHVKPDENVETFEIKSGKNVFTFRVPCAYDYFLFDELKEETKDNRHAFYIEIGKILAVSLNGKPGVNLLDISGMDRFAYSQLIDKINQFQIDVLPESAKAMIPELMAQAIGDLKNAEKV